MKGNNIYVAYIVDEDENIHGHVANQPPWTISKLGGRVHWIHDVDPTLQTGSNQHLESEQHQDSIQPNISQKALVCGNCGRNLFLLMQAYAPLDTIDHRVVYVFGCNQDECSGNSKAWRVIRGQTMDMRQEDEKHGDKDPDPEAKLTGQTPVASSWDAEFGDGEDSLAELEGMLQSLSTNPKPTNNNSAPRTSKPKQDKAKDKRKGNGHENEEGNDKHKETQRKTAVIHSKPVTSSAESYHHLSASTNTTKAHHSNEFPPLRLDIVPDRSIDSETSSMQSEDGLLDEHVQALLSTYQGSESLYEKEDGDKGAWAEDGADEESIAEDDRMLQKYLDFIAKDPDQVVRYCFGGQILEPFRLHDQSEEGCENCGSKRVYEFQLLATMLYHLRVDQFNELGLGMDWTTLGVKVCPASCWAKETQDMHHPQYFDEQLVMWKESFKPTKA